MPLVFGKPEPISIIPEEELSAVDQINVSAFRRALVKKPTYKAYCSLLAYRRALRCLKINVDLLVEEADDGLRKATDNYNKTAQALANACDSTKSPWPTTCPTVAGEVFQNIMELQALYHEEKLEVCLECHFDEGRARAFLDAVNKRVQKLETVLVKKFGIHAVDDEGNPLDMQNAERVIHVMASIPGNENL
ncbi:MAG: hypothetical protein ALECFALPRED_009635 [Alectoria fallacina]|uniref:Uncharacterized protein n=1 Tax=Alectoria fallacina TaxID=1903189 RepID=A0A8H3J7W8_9LECA|nr:MAG: hypothetical protein ALECFALPRED_009635 [Alectoria fallacina]